MQARTRAMTVAIWLSTGTIAALSCALTVTAARYQGEYIPVGNDSFYHARRILDAVANLSGFYQFDPRIHAPEGSLLVWPWGYDLLMASAVRLGLAAGISSDPMAILVWIPVAAVFASIGLLVIIARQLGLSSWLTALTGLCMALATTTQLLHGVGAIDHHYAEMVALLGALAAGLGWLKNPSSVRLAAATALTLGIAPAIHNALFILQLPILAVLFCHWLQDQRLPRRPSLVFACVLVLATLAVSLPSLPLRLGRFEFYTLSWFHPYVATCTAVAVALMSRLPRTRRGCSIFALVLVVLLIPLLSELQPARMFLGGLNRHLDQIGEMQPPLKIALRLGSSFITRVYSALVYLAPITALLCAVQCWRERAAPRLLFWITSLAGLCLLSLQLRMHYFGDFALYLPWLVVCNDWALQRPQLRKKIELCASLAVLLLYAPVLRYQLVAPMPHANDLTFDTMRPVFATLESACAKDPGIVLADKNAGHYVRYFTACSVIADNFLLTQQQFAKADEVDRLFGIRARELLHEAPQVKYVLIAYQPFYKGPHLLTDDLLTGPLSALPTQYKLIHQVTLADSDALPYARLYRIEGNAPQDRE
jgi:hypothetical protein